MLSSQLSTTSITSEVVDLDSSDTDDDDVALLSSSQVVTETSNIASNSIYASLPSQSQQRTLSTRMNSVLSSSDDVLLDDEEEEGEEEEEDDDDIDVILKGRMSQSQPSTSSTSTRTVNSRSRIPSQKSSLLESIDAIMDFTPSSSIPPTHNDTNIITPTQQQQQQQKGTKRKSDQGLLLDDSGNGDDGCGGGEKKKRATTKQRKKQIENLQAEKEANKKREREAEKAAKKKRIEEEKVAKKAFQTTNKLVSRKQDLIKDFTLHVSSSLRQSDLMHVVSNRLAEHGCPVTYLDSTHFSNLFRWERRIRAKYDERHREWTPVPEYKRFEALYMLYFEATSLISQANGIQALNQTVDNLRDEYDLTPKHQIFIMINDLEMYYRKKGKGSRAANATARNEGRVLVNKTDVERTLASLQVAQKCFIVHVEGITDAAEWLYNMTGDLGVKPHKLIERSHLPFCPVMNIKAGTDPEDTYMKMLTQLSKVTGNIADAVMERAPTLRSLFESYQNEPDHHRRNALLSNVVVKYNLDGTKSGRLLNIALSTKIATAFWNQDSLVALT